MKNKLNEYIKFLNGILMKLKKKLNSPFKKACDGLWRDLRPLYNLI